MSDILLQKFFEIKRWESAIDAYQGEGWRMFALMKKVIKDNDFDFYGEMNRIYNK